MAEGTAFLFDPSCLDPLSISLGVLAPGVRCDW